MLLVTVVVNVAAIETGTVPTTATGMEEFSTLTRNFPDNMVMILRRKTSNPSNVLTMVAIISPLS